MATWKKVLVSGSAIEVLNITASNIPDGTTGDFLIIDSEGRIAKTGSGGGGGGGGIFTDQGTFYDTENSLKITGSTLQSAPGGDYNQTSSYASSYLSNNYAFIVSQSAYFDNHNVGHPNNLAWGSNLDGSIFNNYNATTDVSEILRALVGIVSASNGALVANPLPYEYTYGGFRADDEGLENVTYVFSQIFIPQNYTEPNALYLNSKGFNNGAGSAILSEVNNDVRYSADDSYGATLIVRNSNGVYGGEFDAGSNNTPLTLFAQITQSFSDNQTDSDPSVSSTFSTSSLFKYEVNVGQTLSTITVSQINTDVPTVIPPVYKKALTGNVPLLTSRKNGGISFSNISSSGYYKYHGILAGVATSSNATISDVIGGGLANPISQISLNTPYFFTPLTTESISDTAISTTISVSPATATSRSLSGVPYLNGASYDIEITSSNVFKPLYRSNTTVFITSITSTGLSFTNAVNGATTNALGKISSNYVYIGDTEQASNGTVVPDVDSTIRMDLNPSFGGSDDNETNIGSAALTDTTFTFNCVGSNFSNDVTITTSNVNYHTAGTFGQPSASGSLAYFISSDGDDPSTTTNEVFKGEKYRRPIEATTDLADSNAWDSGSRLDLVDGGGLQVKPGYLVNPQSTNRYWYPSTGYNSAHYKWYLREFDTGETGVANNLILDLSPDNDSSLATFSTTTTGKIAIGVLFEYQLNNLGGNNPRIYDVYEGYAGTNTFNLNNGISGGNTQYNPFTDTIDLKAGWAGGSESSGTITMNLSAGNGQIINSSNKKIWLLIRYTGTPVNNLQSIAVSTT